MTTCAPPACATAPRTADAHRGARRHGGGALCRSHRVAAPPHALRSGCPRRARRRGGGLRRGPAGRRTAPEGPPAHPADVRRRRHRRDHGGDRDVLGPGRAASARRSAPGRPGGRRRPPASPWRPPRPRPSAAWASGSRPAEAWRRPRSTTRSPSTPPAWVTGTPTTPRSASSPAATRPRSGRACSASRPSAFFDDPEAFLDPTRGQVVLLPNPVQPHSEGSVTLASADPAVAPRHRPQLLRRPARRGGHGGGDPQGARDRRRLARRRARRPGRSRRTWRGPTATRPAASRVTRCSRTWPATTR